MRSEPRELSRIAHAVALRTGGRVLSVEAADAGRSFHAARLRRRGGEFEILAHALLPLLALAEARGDGDMTLAFRDLQGVEPTGWTPYRLLSADELGTPIDRADLGELSAGELEQIRYWGPGTVGEVLFNFWD